MPGGRPALSVEEKARRAAKRAATKKATEEKAAEDLKNIEAVKGTPETVRATIAERFPDLLVPCAPVENAPKGLRDVTRRPRRPTAVEAEQILELREEFLKEEWEKLLGMIKEGATITESLAQLDIPRKFIDGLLRTSPEAKAQWEDAKLAKIWMHWDFETIEEIMLDLITTDAPLRVIIGDRGLSVSDFYLLTLKDPIVKDMYDDSRQLQMEMWADKLVEIADDDSKDMGVDHKGGDRPNSAAVQRSRLMSDDRKWLMARLHYKRFGDRITQDQNVNLVVDHADRLGQAQKRAEKVLKERIVTEQ